MCETCGCSDGAVATMRPVTPFMMMPIRLVSMVLRIELRVAGGDLVEKVVLIDAPPLVREDFDLTVAGETSGIHPVADFADVDATFAHETAVIEEIGGGCFPIASGHKNAGVRVVA